MDIEEAKNKKAKAEMEIAHILEKLEAETGLKVSNMFYICREEEKSALTASPIDTLLLFIGYTPCLNLVRYGNKERNNNRRSAA